MEIIQTIENGLVKLTAPESYCFIRTSENEDEEEPTQRLLSSLKETR